MAAPDDVGALTDVDPILLDALRGVVDPELGADIVELGMVRGVVRTGTTCVVELALTIAGCPLRDQIRRDVVGSLIATGTVDAVEVEMSPMTAAERSALMDRARRIAQERSSPTAVPDRARILAVVSGKGGVGKSTVTVNLAIALASTGTTVGVLDADIWGFSVPRMLGVTAELAARNGRMVPVERRVGEGLIRVVSMGFLAGEDEAVMWRGLMLNRAVQHFLEDVEWGDLDYLLVDMPPGTGDVQMGLARMLPRAELLVVTTPALAAQKVAGRAADMARRGHLRVAGVIENMAGFRGADGSVVEIFGSGGGSRLADEIGVPLLGSVPMDPEVAAGGDSGVPVAESSQSPAAQLFRSIARQIRDEVASIDGLETCSARLSAAVGGFSPRERP